MALSPYSLAVFVHVLAAIYLIGSSLFSVFVRSAARGARTTGELRSWLAFGARSARFNPVAAMVLLASGLFLGSFGFFGVAWFWVALGMFVANTAIARAVFPRIGRRIAQAAGSAAPDQPVPEAADRARLSRGWDLATALLLSHDLAVLFLMLHKPTLVPALAVVGLLDLLAVCAVLAGSARSKPSAAAALAAD